MQRSQVESAVEVASETRPDNDAHILVVPGADPPRIIADDKETIEHRTLGIIQGVVSAPRRETPGL